jgi:glycerate 2-kinase
MADLDALILDLFSSAVAAADPASAVARRTFCGEHELSLGSERIPAPGKVVVVAVGKAAISMANGLDLTCGCTIDEGFLITTDGHNKKAPGRFRVREAAHPIPDQRGVEATNELLNLVSSCGSDDVVIALISGGGSALLESPRPPIRLEDLAKTTDLLLRAGAPIQDLNAVRTPLSLVKGGGLRQAAPEAQFATLLLSDVLGNDPHVIASGPTVASTATAQTALKTLEKYRLVNAVPSTVRTVLESSAKETPKATVDFSADIVLVVADNEVAVQAARSKAIASGGKAEIIWTAKTGEASDLGRAWVHECFAADDSVDVLLGGGEATVTVRGNGIGGRNTEFVLSACLELERVGNHEWTVASLATDGQDGVTGLAGAIGDGSTCDAARTAGVDPNRALANNDSASVFRSTSGAVETGPTGTNVNDLYVAVRKQ